MLADSSVATIEIEIPAVLNSVHSQPGNASVSGTGHDTSDPLLYEFSFCNERTAEEGTYSGIVKVTDSYPSGLNESPLVNGLDGITRVHPLVNPLTGLFDITEFATYAAFSVDVAFDNPIPIAGTLSLDWECGGDPCSGKLFTLTISEAYNPAGQPVTITWDFDGNLDFDDDLDGDDFNLSGNYIYDNPGNYIAWCRVSDLVSNVDVGPFAINVPDCTPDNPSLITTVDSTFNPSGWGRGRSVAINSDDGYAYVTHETGSAGALSIIDIEPASSASEVKMLTTEYNLEALAYQDGYVYCGGVFLLGVGVYDVDPPEDAYLVTTWLPPAGNTGYITHFIASGDYLYVGSQWWGFMVMDITDPENPVFLDYIGTTTGKYTSSIAVTDDEQYGYYLEGYHDTSNWVRVVDLSYPTDITRIPAGDLQLASMPADCDIEGNYLFEISTDNLLKIIDITSPETPTLLTSYVVGSDTWEVYANENFVYVARGQVFQNDSGRLTIIDVVDPATPSTLADFTIAGWATGVVEYCGTAYVSSSDPSLSIVALY